MPTRTLRPSELAAWTLLALLVIAGVPLFLCMPLWADVTFYDLCARNLLSGGVHYRDVFDTNPPGMPWIHAAVRTCVGWSSEAMRAADLLVVAGIVGLLATCRLVERTRPLAEGSGVDGCRFTRLLFLNVRVGCHCQRDIWEPARRARCGSSFAASKQSVRFLSNFHPPTPHPFRHVRLRRAHPCALPQPHSPTSPPGACWKDFSGAPPCGSNPS